MSRKVRIHLDDSLASIILKMSDGNPGCISVLTALLHDKKTDPDNALGGIGVILNLDSYGIYGTDIWGLYSDICDKDIVKMIAVIRACQLGFFNRVILADAAHREDYSGKSMVPVDELYLKVKAELPNFNSGK